MQMAALGRPAVKYLEGKSCRDRHRQRGLGVSQETPCKTVSDLARFGSAKCLNHQARHRPLGSTNTIKHLDATRQNQKSLGTHRAHTKTVMLGLPATRRHTCVEGIRQTVLVLTKRDGVEPGDLVRTRDQLRAWCAPTTQPVS